jgi:chemotaxis phosphatase CheX-like protein
VTDHIDLEEIRPDLETLLGDVLRSVLEEEAEVLPDGVDLPRSDDDAPPAVALLAIADDADASRLGVRVEVPGRLAHTLAARMFGTDEPETADLLDAVGELGNIAGGNVKALLFGATGSARLSLPSAVLVPAATPTVVPADIPAPTSVRAFVLGDVAELTLIPRMSGDDLVWPPVVRSEVLEGQP